MTHPHPRTSYIKSHIKPELRSAFSLIQLSAIIVAAGLVAAAVIPEGGGDSQAMRYLTTIKRMEKVEEASVKMMARWGRRPCPASGEYHPGHANFGKEDGTRGDCTDSGATDGILTPFDDTNVVAGTVPIGKLHLPVDYYFDGWGRPLTYVVDKRATQKSQCLNINGSGDVKIFDGNIAGGGTQTDQTMVALISHGPDGHGSFQPGGSVRTARLNFGSNDADQFNNAGVAGATDFSPTTFVNEWVKRESIGASDYDDVTWYNPRTKNTCCFGKGCSGNSVDIHEIWGELISQTSMSINNTVDINADGFNEIVIFSENNGSSNRHNYWYIIYGTADNKANIPNPLKLSEVGTTIPGFVLTSAGQRGGSLSVQDANSDGNNDLIVRAPNTNCNHTGQGYIFYGGVSDAGFTGSYNVSQFGGTPTPPSDATRFFHQSCASEQFADMNNDGHNDWIVAYGVSSSSTGLIKMIHGKAGGWGSTVDLNPSSCPSGFTCTDIKPTDLTAGREWGEHAAVGDFNGDGCTDVASQISFGTGVEAAYTHVVFGQSIANCGTAADMPATINIDDLDGSTGVKFERYSGNCFGLVRTLLGDINNDGYDDLIHTCRTSGSGALTAFGGPGPRTGDGTFETSWVGHSPLSIASLNGANGTKLLSGTAYASSRGFIDDVNGDGIADFANVRGGDDGVGVVYGQESSFVWPSAVAESSLTTSTGFYLNYSNRSEIYQFTDINGDGHKDLYWGTPAEDSNNGITEIILAPDDGIWPTTLAIADVDFTVVDTAFTTEKLSTVESVVDINEDGIADLFINAPDAEPDPSVTSGGIGYIIWSANDELKNPLDIFEVSNSDPIEVD